jgi:hypothetical protein
MRCPVCKSPLLVVEWRRVELDHCPACHGTWFDAGELDLLLAGAGLAGEAGLRELMAHPPTDVDEKRLKCPRCARRMRKVVVPGAAGPVLDLCAVGDGIWFDRGEVTALAAALAGTGSTAAAHLGEYLGDLFR